MVNRNWVKLDRYALIDLTRQERLSAAESMVLLVLVLLADFRTGEWKGTIVELAEHAPVTRTTVTKVCNHLSELRLITLLTPFRQNSAAWIRVDCYEGLVLLGKPLDSPGRVAPPEPSGSESRAPIRVESVREEVPIEENCANEQEELAPIRDLGERERGVRPTGPVLGPACKDCGRPMLNAPYGENCQCPF